MFKDVIIEKLDELHCETIGYFKIYGHVLLKQFHLNKSLSFFIIIEGALFQPAAIEEKGYKNAFSNFSVYKYICNCVAKSNKSTTPTD